MQGPSLTLEGAPHLRSSYLEFAIFGWEYGRLHPPLKQESNTMVNVSEGTCCVLALSPSSSKNSRSFGTSTSSKLSARGT
jgi:hypothetical protein